MTEEYCIQISDPRGGRWRVFTTYPTATRGYVAKQVEVQRILHPGANFRLAKREVGEWEEVRDEQY